MTDITAKTAMLAKAPDDSASCEGWLLEPKFDGHRMIAAVESDIDGTGVRMFARSGRDKTGKLPAIEADLALLASDYVLDGEVCATDGSWGKVQEVLGASTRTSTDLQFVVFDVLEVMGEDVRHRPLTARRELLEQVIALLDVRAGGSMNVVIAPQEPYSADRVTELIAAGWEGAIVKRPDSTYQSGRRSTDWMKFKAVDTVDVVVLGSTAGQGKYTDQIGALQFGVIADPAVDKVQNLVVVDGTTYAIRGRCSGMTDAEREAFTAARDDGTLNGTVIEVAHMGIMPTGGWRHPQYKRTRTDKVATDCDGSSAC